MYVSISGLNVLNFFWQLFNPFNSLSVLAKRAKTSVQPYVLTGSAFSLQRVLISHQYRVQNVLIIIFENVQSP
jgi:hypothetical protein